MTQSRTTPAKTVLTPAQVLFRVMALIVIVLGMSWIGLLVFTILQLPAAVATTQETEAQATQKNTAQSAANTLPSGKDFFALPNEYQNSISNDIQKYAQLSGVGSVRVQFSASNLPTTTIPVAAASVTFTTAAEYSKIMQFLTMLESNLPKITILDIEINADPNPQSQKVNVSKLLIITPLQPGANQ